MTFPCTPSIVFLTARNCSTAYSAESMTEPRSIFGSETATAPDSDKTHIHRVAPLQTQTQAPERAPTWTPNLRLDLGALNSSAGGSAGAGAGAGGEEGAAVALHTPPVVAGRKRRPPATPAERDSATSPASEPLHKRRRIHRAPRYSVDLSRTSSTAAEPPPSPLFFSRSSRPHLAPRFSSGEAAARMLSNTQGEEGGIKTVHLARGAFNGLSPPATTNNASGRSSERSSMPRTASPDARDRHDRDPLRLLSSVNIIELLEQDTRPTFIVDIGHLANYTPESSSLQILFANTALRSSPATWELVAGKAPESLHAEVEDNHVQATLQFRKWLLSTVTHGDSPGPNPSPVEHGSVVWSCYTLRKRLRVISGAVPTHAAASITPASAPGPGQFSVPSTSSLGAVSASNMQTSPFSVKHGEPQDYFGSTVPAIVEEELPITSTEAQNQLVKARTIETRDISGIFQTAPTSTLSPSENRPSYNNECVLSAQSAGNIDSYTLRSEQGGPPEHDMGFFDWTRLPMSATLPRHIQFARSVDWANTPLGPIEFWSNDLRAMCNLIM